MIEKAFLPLIDRTPQKRFSAAVLRGVADEAIIDLAKTMRALLTRESQLEFVHNYRTMIGSICDIVGKIHGTEALHQLTWQQSLDIYCQQKTLNSLVSATFMSAGLTGIGIDLAPGVNSFRQGDTQYTVQDLVAHNGLTARIMKRVRCTPGLTPINDRLIIYQGSAVLLGALEYKQRVNGKEKQFTEGIEYVVLNSIAHDWLQLADRFPQTSSQLNLSHISTPLNSRPVPKVVAV